MSSSRIAAVASLLAVLALIVAGCGGSSYGSSSSSRSTAASGSERPGGSMTISAAEVPELGMVLVESEGFTVYSFARDKGTASSCYGACAEAWPPVTVTGKPKSEKGAMSSELGTTKRKDGTVQVTYAGHPLYTFVEDQNAGEANGNGVSAFGGEWNALEESGSAPVPSAGGEAESKAPAEGNGESGDSRYGY
jgi:predicted lipoprotein with Yx(FWY)xxD motif